MSKRNRIGIETIERAVVLTNYGSFWQHYALRRVLKRFGYEPFRCESHPEVNVLREWMVPFRIARVWLLSLIGLRRRPHILDFVRPFLQFRFVKDYHRLIGPIFERDRGADAYLAGGDSVWCGKNRHCFLLDRASGIRRISYAPSSAWYKK